MMTRVRMNHHDICVCVHATDDESSVMHAVGTKSVCFVHQQTKRWTMDEWVVPPRQSK